jgi:biotin operon repressor
MPHPSTPATDRARALLLEKQTYGDVTAATGLSRQQVGAIASRLRRQGYELLDWTPEQKRRRLISIMPKGSVAGILSGLSDAELKALSERSLVSWEDAIRKVIQDHD